MGVPRLRHLLEPYAELVDLKGHDLVIDGPALAYHILYQCQRQADSLFNLPSYSVMGQTAIRWLNELTESGANISAIYFDGYLPTTKEPERRRRLGDLTKGLRSYFSLHPTSVPKGRSQVPTSEFEFSSAAGSSKRLPTPPFLVPAVLEALSMSETYRLVTKLVPGEADIFCARHVSPNGNGGIIITSDSDLLVHDLGHQGGVVFFSDVEFKLHAGRRVATAAEYSVSHICERLSVPRDAGFARIAFEVNLDRHVTLKQAVQLVKEKTSEVYASEYAAFMAQYLTPEIIEHASLQVVPGRLLDPRISELVLQLVLQSSSPDPTVVAHRSGQENADISMYLPFLIDSPARTSAWETSTSLRQLAYGLGQLLVTEQIAGVVEFRRLQSLTGGTHVEALTTPDIDKRSKELLDNMIKIRACVTERELQWVALAISQDIVVSNETGKYSILSLDLLQAAANSNLDIGSWDFVHLHAQVQGIYYSLRMLGQVADFVSCHTTLSKPISEMQRVIGRLSILEDFPSIAEFSVLFSELRTSIDLPELVGSLGLGDEVSSRVQTILNPRDKKQKRKRCGKSAGQARITTRIASPGFRSNNLFDLLGGG